jgi:hypothetical protein
MSSESAARCLAAVLEPFKQRRSAIFCVIIDALTRARPLGRARTRRNTAPGHALSEGANPELRTWQMMTAGSAAVAHSDRPHHSVKG